MGRVFAIVGLLVVVLLVLDLTGVVPLVLSQKAQNTDDDPALVEGEAEVDGEGVALHGSGGGKKKEAEPEEPEEVVPPSEVFGTRPNGSSIRGRVVQGSPALPMEGVRVTLSRPDSIFSYLRADVNGRFDELEAHTDSEGRFAFLDIVPSENYVVRARHPKFAIASSHKLDLRGRRALQLPDLTLVKGGVITGRILDVSGAAVANARVVVTWEIVNPLQTILTSPEEVPEIEGETKTGADGTFRLEGIEQGTKSIIVVAPSGASDAKDEAKLGERLDLGDWQIGGTHFLAGRVMWSDGTGIEGVRVVAGPFGNPIARQTLSGADGSFRIEHLPEARAYAVGTMVPGLPVALLLNVKLDRDDLEVRIKKPARLHGRVVRADTKAPVPRFRIHVKQPPTGEFVADMIARVVSQALGATPFEDESGRFVFERMGIGKAVLEIRAPGHPPVKREVTVTAESDEELVIELPAGKRATGRVTGSDGEPVPHARVFAVEPNADEEERAVFRGLSRRTPAAVADAEGRFELAPQTPGTYTLVAQAEHRRPGRLDGVVLGDEDVEGLKIVLPPYARIKGRVVDTQGDVVNERVNIDVFFSDFTTTQVVSKEDGTFKLDGTPVGGVVLRWSFEVEHTDRMGIRDPEKAQDVYERMKAATEEHQLHNGRTLKTVVTLPRRTLVKGRVMDAGAVAKGVPAIYWVKAGTSRFVYCRCRKGTFEYRVAPGMYQVYLPNDQDAWTPQSVEIPDMSEYELELERPRAE